MKTMDLRGLTPPEPLTRVLEALSGDDADLTATFPHPPNPLFLLLGERGYAYEVLTDEPGRCVVRIRRPS